MLRLLALATAIVALVGCVDPPTSVLLEVHPSKGLPAVEALSLTLFDAQGIVVKARPLLKQGTLELPDTVVLYPNRDSGELRVQVLGLVDNGVVGEGTTRVTLVSRAQVWGSVIVSPGRRSDADGDGVPDSIDNCRDLPNPAQQSCTDDGGSDGPNDGGADTDLLPPDLVSPDQDCDKDKDGYDSTACGGTDCDDSADKANPGQKEGPAGGASCSDSLDNDCDGTTDLNDSDCVNCKGNAECDDKLSCTADSCSGGVCKNTATNEGQTCTDNACVTTPTCVAGKCTGPTKTCPPPSNTCKAAACNPASGCYTKNVPDGSTCSDGDPCTTQEACKSGSCVDPSASSSCYISSTCYDDNYAPDSCRSCDVSSSTSSWTLASGYCYINGTCRASGYKPNACRICTPSSSTTSYALVSGYCYISGKCYTNGAAGTGCQVCNTSIDRWSWSAKPNCGVVLVALNSGFTGNLGGISGANAKCATQAAAAGLTGTFKAVLSSTTQSAKALLSTAQAAEPVYNSRGELLYSSWNAMWSPSKWTGSNTIWSFAGKKVDEGLGAAPNWDDADAWHGSTSKGVLRTGLTCTDWTVTTGNGSVGEIDMNTFTTQLESRACSLTLAVICVRIPS
jgi:Collagenase NC10 and Endostatin